SMLYLVNRVLPPEIISAGAALATGLAGGFTARGWLGNARMGLRLAAGLAASVLGQAFLGWVTWGFVGVHLQAADRLGPDWGGLSRIALGGLAVVLSLQAYGIPRVNVPEFPEVPEVNNRSAPSRRAARGPRLRVRRRSGFLPGIRRVARSIGRPRRAHVRLQRMIEHRCPYCLEPVLRRDPRGEVTCPECRTRHHADCWAVTGMCQVPHHHR
ncbi:MAG: hypothetical protein ACRDG5_06795, partial [Anaerolineales bacterium]